MLGRSPTAGYEDVQQEASRTVPDAINESVQSVMNLDLRPRLSSLKLPLLVLYGENDGVITPSPQEAPSASAFKLTRVC